MATFRVKHGSELSHAMQGGESKTYAAGETIELSEEEVKKYGDLLEPAEVEHHMMVESVATKAADTDLLDAPEAKSWFGKKGKK